MGSVLLSCAERSAVPAGGALAVERERFSALVEAEVASRDLIEVVRGEERDIPEGPCVIAAGPLCSKALSERVLALVGGSSLSFFDAAAPIVDAATIDRSVVFSQSRYGEEGGGDYLNAPFTREEYERFIDALLGAKRVVLKDFERRELFQACRTGRGGGAHRSRAIRFGAMKPVGLTDPHGQAPVGGGAAPRRERRGHGLQLGGLPDEFDVREQKRVFRMIPGLEHAEFFRYGVMHRNTFVDAPHVLDDSFAVPRTRVRLAGQIHGYRRLHRGDRLGPAGRAQHGGRRDGRPARASAAHWRAGFARCLRDRSATVDYQPMHVNFGVVPPLEDGRRRASATAMPPMPTAPCAIWMPIWWSAPTCLGSAADDRGVRGRAVRGD